MKRVTSSIAVLSALDNGAHTIADIASTARMTARASQQTLMRLRNKGYVVRKNEHRPGLVAEFKINAAGRKVLKEALS